MYSPTGSVSANRPDVSLRASAGTGADPSATMLAPCTTRPSISRTIPAMAPVLTDACRETSVGPVLRWANAPSAISSVEAETNRKTTTLRGIGPPGWDTEQTFDQYAVPTCVWGGRSPE